MEEVIEFGTLSVIGENCRAVLEHCGEGLNGDYDPDNPNDTPLLRFDVYVRPWVGGEDYCMFEGWVVPQDCSYCTAMSAESSDEDILKALRYIVSEMDDAIASRASLKKTAERLSWLS